MPQKGFSPVIILVLIAATVVGYFGYRFLKSPNQSSSPSLTNVTTSTPTSNWKTYSDRVLGFSIGNPVNWYLKLGDERLTKFKGSSSASIANLPDIFQSRFLKSNQAVIYIDKYPKSEEGLGDLNGEEFYNLKNVVWQNRKDTSEGGAEKMTKTYSIVSLNNLEVVKENVISYGSTEGPDLNTTLYLFPDPKSTSLIWVIRTETLLKDIKADLLQNQIVQILSTFKLTQ